MADTPATSIRITRDGVEVSEPGRSAEDLVPVLRDVLALLPVADGMAPFGFTPSGGTSLTQDRRPTPNLDRGLSNGKHRPPPSPAVTDRSET